MRILGLILALGAGAANAADWHSASQLPGTHRASPAECAALADTLRSALVVYNIEDCDAPIVIHDGDLAIDGNLDNDVVLVVRGNLVVDGLYDDYRDGIGVLIVLGDMRVQNVYSWGAMHVQGDLVASGLLMTVYNDFTFAVDGKLSARALVVSDKSADYEAGEIAVEWTDDREDADVAAALRTFEPDLFTHPSHFELDEDADLSWLGFDEGRARDHLSAGQPVFRAQAADAALPQWAQAAIDPATSNDALEALVGKDRLVDQLLATREDLPKPLAQRLLASGDAIVLAWLAITAPQVLLGADLSAITPEAAKSLAADAATGDDDLQRIATHADARVRIALAEREELSTALIHRLAGDADADVRAAVIGAFSNALELEPDMLAARLRDDSPAVRDALAGARVDSTQALALVPRLSEQGLRDFARHLLAQARGARPTALDAAGIVTAADAVLARGTDAATDAFLSLPAATQLERFDALVATRSLDLSAIAEHTPQRALIERIVAFADAADAPLPYQLGRNPRLPETLQLDIVARAAKTKPDPDDYSMDTPDELLSTLLGNDDVADAAVLAATELALERGLAPDDGGMQNALFHHRNLPPASIAALDRELAGSEDWALTLMLQRRATAAQVDRALRRWYDDRDEIVTELRRIEARNVDDYFAALASAKHTELREIAAWNLATPVASLVRLVDDPEPAVASSAAMHPDLPTDTRVTLVRRAPPDAYENLRLPADQWQELATTLPTRTARLAALAEAARTRERAMP